MARLLPRVGCGEAALTRLGRFGRQLPGLGRSGLFLAYESHVASPWVPLLFIGLALAVGTSVGRIPTGGIVAEEQPS